MKNTLQYYTDMNVLPMLFKCVVRTYIMDMQDIMCFLALQ